MAASSFGPDRSPTDVVTVLIGLAVGIGVVAILERHQRRHLRSLRDDDTDG